MNNKRSFDSSELSELSDSNETKKQKAESLKQNDPKKKYNDETSIDTLLKSKNSPKLIFFQNLSLKRELEAKTNLNSDLMSTIADLEKTNSELTVKHICEIEKLKKELKEKDEELEKLKSEKKEYLGLNLSMLEQNQTKMLEKIESLVRDQNSQPKIDQNYIQQLFENLSENFIERLKDLIEIHREASMVPTEREERSTVKLHNNSTPYTENLIGATFTIESSHNDENTQNKSASDSVSNLVLSNSTESSHSNLDSVDQNFSSYCESNQTNNVAEVLRIARKLHFT